MAKRPSSRATQTKSSAADTGLRLFRIPGLPEIHLGDDLAGLIADAARKARLVFDCGDILVIAQKVVSKAEGAVVRLATVRPSAQALALGARLKKDPRAIEVVLQQ